MDTAFLSLRPMVFDVAGLTLIGSIVLYMAYIRYDRPWMARFAFWGIFISGAPLLYFVMTGYYGS